ncbi:hypothetical protein BD413DRAFT_473444 [Trametes elegans]|nr:hypothetical protein BD413DRAFT_473444 [Trametes elegans]
MRKPNRLILPGWGNGVPTRVVIALLALLSCANLAVDLLLVRQTRQNAALRHMPVSKYSFVGEDYPPHLPLPGARRAVRLTVEESVRYDPAHPEFALEWEYAGVPTDANIRLGPKHRFLNTGFSYQSHCLGIILFALRDEHPPPDGRQRAHVTRCLNVIRQFALCSADTTLEPVDSATRNFTAVRDGGEHRCVDWPALYETMVQNWDDWTDFQGTSHL